MDQISAIGMMKKIVPITRFNKGEASKIFDEVQKNGTKIVVKTITLPAYWSLRISMSRLWKCFPIIFC